MFGLGLLIGMIAGACIGFMLFALCVAAGEKEWEEEEQTEDYDAW